MRRVFIGAVLLILACGGAATLPAPSQSAPAPTGAAAPTAAIDVSDMMGFFPPTTFFVVTPDSVKAVALLNHATKYSISIDRADAQVAVDAAAQRVYVMDQTAAGARLRAFDVSTGAARGSYVIPRATVVPSDSAHATLAIGSNGDILALVGQGELRSIEQFSGSALEPVRRVLGDLRCGDHIAAAAGRMVLTCMDEGGIVTVEPGGGGKFRADAALVAMAMLPDGTLLVGSADASLWRLAPGAATLEPIVTLKERGRSLLKDGIASQGNCCFLFGVVDSVANPQVRIVTGGFTVVLFPDTQRPQGGILVQPPFAYYTVGSQARHIDIQQGFAETMAEVGGRALPGAVADR